MNYINGGAGTYNKPTSVVDSGLITQANNRGDYTATNAFYWANGLDLSAYQDGRHFLVVYDSGGRGAGGFISATAPVGDGGGNALLGAELLPNPSFDVNTTGWLTDYGSVASVAGGQSNNCAELTRISGSLQNLYVASINQIGKLFYGSGYVRSGTSGNESFRILIYPGSGASSNSIINGTSSGAWTKYSLYGTFVGANGNFSSSKLSGTSGTMLFDEMSLMQVTDPPPTGVRIVSTKGGVTRNWTWKNASFNPNTACSYTITYVGN